MISNRGRSGLIRLKMPRQSLPSRLFVRHKRGLKIQGIYIDSIKRSSRLHLAIHGLPKEEIPQFADRSVRQGSVDESS